MEPISVAVAAFAAIKSGVKLGKDAQSMMSDIGKMWGAIDEVRGEHKKKKKSPFTSANEEALETFAALKKAEDLEHELEKIVKMTRGFYAWQELLKIRGQIKRERMEAEQARKAKAAQQMELAAAVALFITLVCCMIWGVWMFLT
jgi:desulfoferrodoxin (superoxide reductase-like protein)